MMILLYILSIYIGGFHSIHFSINSTVEIEFLVSWIIIFHHFNSIPCHKTMLYELFCAF